EKTCAGEPDHALHWLSAERAARELLHQSQRWAVTRAQCSARLSQHRHATSASHPLMSDLMISLPYFLLAIGIFIFIVACFLGGLSQLSGLRRNVIDPRMSDNQIIKNLRREQRVSLPTNVGIVGLLCILGLIARRLALVIA